MSGTNWADLRHEILSKLDLKSEYRSLGVEVTGETPNHNGWVACRSYGKQDRNPSAGINISGETGWHGRYREFTGNGRSMLLFDFAVDIGKFPDFISAVKHYAERAGVSMPRGRPPETPVSQLIFKPWNNDLVANWCRIKSPISAQAVQICGGRIAQWPKKSGKFTVIAFPAYGENLIDGDPCGFQVYSITGQPLPLYQGDGQPPKMLKVLTVTGSRSGFVGRYGLSLLAKAEVVWKVEGITDLLAVQTAIIKYFDVCSVCSGDGNDCKSCINGKVYPYARKHVVLTTSGGSMEFPEGRYMNHLVGKKVFVLHDADKDGQSGAKRWFDECSKVAAECRHIVLPYPVVENHGPDVRDWLNEGNTYRSLLDLTESPLSVIAKSSRIQDGTAIITSSPIPVEQPPSESVKTKSDIIESEAASIQEVSHVRQSPTDSQSLAMERRVCEMLRIQVVGEDEKMGIEIFSLKHGKSTVVENISYLTYEQLIQICGEEVKQCINLNLQVDVPGQIRLSQIKQSIAALAGYQRASNAVKSGRGCWCGLDPARNRKNSVVVVGGHEGFEWDGDKGVVHRIKQPIHGGLILDFKNEDTWYDFELINGYLRKAEDPAWCLESVEKLIEIFTHWNWKYKLHTPKVMAGLVMSSWVQTLWYWRPLIALTGPSDAGKTTVFETLDNIFGGLSLRSSKSTEAGIRQGLGNNASILLCDEFENDNHRQRILELFRTSSKGDRTLRGTTNQRGQTFGLKHICWVAAVEVGFKREPDRNRFIQLELKRPDSRKRGKMDWLPLPHQLADLGLRLLAVAIRNVHRATVLSDAMRTFRMEGVHGRVIESYAVPIAMLASVTGNTEDVAREYMSQILGEIEFEGYTSADEHNLIGSILSSTVDLGSDGRPSVSQLLSFPGRHITATSGLEKSGIGVVEGMVKRDGNQHKEPFLFISTATVCRVLLRDTEWKDQAIDQILRRLPGAEMARHRIAGQLCGGVRIPFSFISDVFLGDKNTPNDGTVTPNPEKTLYDDNW